MCTYEAMGIDRILLATDYPYEDSNERMQFLERLPIAQEDKDKILLSKRRPDRYYGGAVVKSGK
jgi:hypothetical protein